MSALAYEAPEQFSAAMHAAAIRYRRLWSHLIVNERLFEECLAWAQSLPKYRLPPRRRPLAEYARSEEDKGSPTKLRAPWGSAWRLRSIPEQDHNYVINGARLLHAQDGKRGEASDDAMNRACQIYTNDKSFDVSLTSRDRRRAQEKRAKDARRELSQATSSGDPDRIKAAEKGVRGNWVTVSHRVGFHGRDDEGNETGAIAADVEGTLSEQAALNEDDRWEYEPLRRDALIGGTPRSAALRHPQSAAA